MVAHVAQHRDRKPRAVDDLELPDRIVGAHAEALPHLLHGSARGSVGKLSRTAANLQPGREGRSGQTRGLAFGAYGEASPDVHALLTVAADGLAARQ